MSRPGIELQPFEQLVNSYSDAESSTYELDQWRNAHDMAPSSACLT
jgi:hypothetical protein